jgi:hypothetical protein
MGKDYLVDMETDRRIVLKSILKSQDIRVWTELTYFTPECNEAW